MLALFLFSLTLLAFFGVLALRLALWSPVKGQPQTAVSASDATAGADFLAGLRDRLPEDAPEGARREIDKILNAVAKVERMEVTPGRDAVRWAGGGTVVLDGLIRQPVSPLDSLAKEERGESANMIHQRIAEAYAVQWKSVPTAYSSTSKSIEAVMKELQERIKELDEKLGAAVKDRKV